MNTLLLRRTWYRCKHRLQQKWQTISQRFKQLKRWQQGLIGSIGLIVVLLLLVCFISKPATQHKTKVNYPVHFEQPTKPIVSHHKHVSVKNTTNQLLQTKLVTLQKNSQQQYTQLNQQLQALQSSLNELPSQQSLQQLQLTMNTPNQALLGKVDMLQHTVQTIVKQTAKKQWLAPELVEQYFRLAAIQGFSDGMRAIIDVNGHQTVLSPHEPCPACRGWVLVKMDFPNQQAIFKKTTGSQTHYVKLHVN